MIMVAGIDGGGTKTTVEVCGQNGELVKRKTFGAFNLNSIGEAAFEQLLGEIFDFIKACGEVHTVCIGAAGISNPSVQMLTEKVKKEKKFPGELLLRGDHEIALYGAVRDAAGCILIAGTGSICLGKKNSNSEEKLIRAGGWGHLIDDGGSGYSLGRDALNAVVQSYDKRKMQQY